MNKESNKKCKKNLIKYILKSVFFVFALSGLLAVMIANIDKVNNEKSDAIHEMMHSSKKQ